MCVSNSHEGTHLSHSLPTTDTVNSSHFYNIEGKTLEKHVTCSVVKMTNCCDSTIRLVLHLNEHRLFQLLILLSNLITSSNFLP